MQRAPSSQNRGGHRRDALPPPEMEEGIARRCAPRGKTIHFIHARPPPEMEEGIDATCARAPLIHARPPPEMEEGIDATRALIPKWRRVSKQRARGRPPPEMEEGIATRCARAPGGKTIHFIHARPDATRALLLSFLFGQLSPFFSPVSPSRVCAHPSHWLCTRRSTTHQPCRCTYTVHTSSVYNAASRLHWGSQPPQRKEQHEL
jgi:hypothetical protein